MENKFANFIKPVSILVGGTLFAHFCTASAMPVLTRLYKPEEFAALAILTSITGIVSAFGCLRFDVAITIPKEDSEAFDLLLLSMASAMLVALVSVVIYALLPVSLIDALNLDKLGSFYVILPLAGLFTCINSALQNWFIREKQFKALSRNKIAQTTVSVGSQVLLGWIGGTRNGLSIGFIGGYFTSSLGYIFFFLKSRQSLFKGRNFSIKRLANTFIRFSDYPKYSTFSALCNSAAIQLPIILISIFANKAEVGYLGLATTVMQAPMAILGSAIGQVYLSKAKDHFADGTLKDFTLNVIEGLFKTGVGPLLVIGILAPNLFGFIFGENWSRAGSIVMMLTPWYVLQFIVAPVSMSLYVTGHQRGAMLLQVSGLILRVSAVLFPYVFNNNLYVESYALSGVVFYLIYLIFVITIVGIKLTDLSLIFKKTLPILLMWTGAASVVLSSLLSFRILKV